MNEEGGHKINSTEQSLCKADSYSASQGIPCLLHNLKVQFCVHRDQSTGLYPEAHEPSPTQFL
jgi:hypothetical protein